MFSFNKSTTFWNTNLQAAHSAGLVYNVKLIIRWKKKEDSFTNQLTAWTGTDTGLPLSDAVHNVSNLQRVSGFFF